MRRKIGSGAIQRQRDDIQPCASDLCQLVDRGAAMLKIQHHLFRHFSWKGRNALGGNAVISCKNNHLRGIYHGLCNPAPAAVPRREFFQTAQRSWGFGQHGIAVLRLFQRGQISFRGLAQKRGKPVKSGKCLCHVQPHCMF